MEPEQGNRGRTLASKWIKTQALLEHPDLIRHIPPTVLYTPKKLEPTIDEHGVVILKPVVGAGGLGVMKVARTGTGYSCTYGKHTRSISSMPELLRVLAVKMRGRSYLIQKGIDLAVIDGRPIDYRVKYVKTGDRWVIRSMVGRLAKPGLFVTNLCRGGLLLSGSEGLAKSLSAKAAAAKKREMRQITKTATSHLESRFPGLNQLGYDYGIDRKGHIWILEVNTRPQ